MSAAVLAWAVAAVSLAWAVATLTVLRRRAELVARAAHELAGPLQAASLALHAARREGPAPRLAAVDLELWQAGLRAARARADPVQLAQAVGNLLANALEHGEGRGRRVTAARCASRCSTRGAGCPRRSAR